MIFVLKIDVLDAAKKAAQNWNLAPLEKYVDFKIYLHKPLLSQKAR